MNVKYPPQCNNPASRASFTFRLREDLRLKFNAGEITRGQRRIIITQAIGPAIGEAIANVRQEKKWKPTLLANMTYDGNGKATVVLPQTNPIMHEGSVAIFCHEFDDVLRAEGIDPDESTEAEAIAAQMSAAKKGAQNGNYWPTANMEDGIE